MQRVEMACPFFLMDRGNGPSLRAAASCLIDGRVGSDQSQNISLTVPVFLPALPLFFVFFFFFFNLFTLLSLPDDLLSLSTSCYQLSGASVFLVFAKANPRSFSANGGTLQAPSVVFLHALDFELLKVMLTFLGMLRIFLSSYKQTTS